ncbi:MAG: helix-turn-helix domain-containing protein [Nocardioides sp.]
MVSIEAGVDPTERAHLLDEQGFTPPVHRFAPGPEAADLVRRFWVPVWSLPAGAESVQRVLQYPVCHLVIASDYAIVVGPQSGMSTKTLTGAGWAFGTMLQPATAALLWDGSVRDLVNGTRALTEVAALDANRLSAQVRALLGDRPEDHSAHRRAAEMVERALLSAVSIDAEGRLVNAIVDYVEHTAEVQRVAQVCEKFAVAERTLQRLTARRTGLSPKWLIQRRRLQEAAERLAGSGPGTLARVATDLGYADQAHFARDFRSVTGLTPSEFAAEPRPAANRETVRAGNRGQITLNRI